MLRFGKTYLPSVILSVIASLVVVNLVLTILLLLTKTSSDLVNFDKIAEPDAYQAVFLGNDQIYFGHLKNMGSGYVLLTDVYYVKIDENSVGQLVKLGQIEPHGPKDEMVINKDHILFWENLRLDSPVVQTIQKMNAPK